MCAERCKTYKTVKFFISFWGGGKDQGWGGEEGEGQGHWGGGLGRQ